jgi:hypothetical protein
MKNVAGYDTKRLFIGGQWRFRRHYHRHLQDHGKARGGPAQRDSGVALLRGC